MPLEFDPEHRDQNRARDLSIPFWHWTCLSGVIDGGSVLHNEDKERDGMIEGMSAKKARLDFGYLQGNAMEWQRRRGH